jgi:hypothetical protein
MPSTKSRGKTRVPVKKTRRRRRKGVLTGLWGATTAMLGVAFLLVEGTFLLIALILSGITLALTALAEFVPQDSLGTDRPVRDPKPVQPRGSRGKSPSGPVIRCKATAKPIDVCSCARRHVRSADGAQRYGLPVGSPIVAGGKS